jgi:tellurite resistance protein
MEVGILLFIFIAWIVIRNISSNSGSSVSTSPYIAVPKKMELFEIRTREEEPDDDGDGIKVIRIEARGLIPVVRQTEIGFITSVYDKTDEKPRPVISHIEQFQEKESSAYHFLNEAGTVGPNEGYISWAQVGVVLPDILYPPKGGNRKLMIVLRIIDLKNPPAIFLGYVDPDEPGHLFARTKTINYHFDDKGYEEVAIAQEEARSLAVKLAMAIALADDSLDDSEVTIIKDWIRRTTAPYPDEKQKALNKLFNTSVKEAYADAKSGSLTLSDITERMNEIGEEPQKLEAIELCFDVMAADGVADESELQTIKNIAKALELDYDEIERMRDKRLIKLDVAIEQQASIETILGIEPDWSNDQTKKHLRDEFAKWNNRLNTLGEGEERDNAQRMLDMISEARTKYA